MSSIQVKSPFHKQVNTGNKRANKSGGGVKGTPIMRFMISSLARRANLERPNYFVGNDFKKELEGIKEEYESWRVRRGLAKLPDSRVRRKGFK